MTAAEQSLLSKLADKSVGELVEQMSHAEAERLNDEYGTRNYKPLPVTPVKADGLRVWTPDGTEYIDCIGAYSAVAHGHRNAEIVQELQDQLSRVAVVSRAYLSAELGLFSQGLCEYADLEMACAMNTGAEAVETAIKLARKWAYTVKGVPKDKAEIIVCTDNFHGRTTTIVGFSTEEQYYENFGPYDGSFKVVPFGDAEALRQAITPNTAAFLCEPIQAEGGINIAPDGWMAEVRRICDETNTLLIWDEVQTGFCRTGHRFAWMAEDAKPDIMTVGKPLGGGILPISAAVGKKSVMDVFEPGDHGSTFGGNPLACAVALRAMAVMEKEDYCGQSQRSGDALAQSIRDLNLPHIKEVRHRGLLIGIEVDDSVDTKALSKAFLDQRILTKETRQRTFRLTPPIEISAADLDEIAKRCAVALMSAA